jgi:hypothetical protein
VLQEVGIDNNVDYDNNGVNDNFGR